MLSSTKNQICRGKAEFGQIANTHRTPKLCSLANCEPESHRSRDEDGGFKRLGETLETMPIARETTKSINDTPAPSLRYIRLSHHLLLISYLSYGLVAHTTQCFLPTFLAKRRNHYLVFLTSVAHPSIPSPLLPTGIFKLTPSMPFVPFTKS